MEARKKEALAGSDGDPRAAAAARHSDGGDGPHKGREHEGGNREAGSEGDHTQRHKHMRQRVQRPPR